MSGSYRGAVLVLLSQGGSQVKVTDSRLVQRMQRCHTRAIWVHFNIQSNCEGEEQLQLLRGYGLPKHRDVRGGTGSGSQTAVACCWCMRCTCAAPGHQNASNTLPVSRWGYLNCARLQVDAGQLIQVHSVCVAACHTREEVGGDGKDV